MVLIEMSYFACGPPLMVAISGIAQVEVRQFVEPTCSTEDRCGFMRNRLVVNKAVIARRADGDFIEVHRLAILIFNARNLSFKENGSAFKVDGTLICPNLKLLMVGNQSCKMWSLRR